jgi:hypothetical protein
MLADEMKRLSSQSRDNDNGFNKQWEEMQEAIRKSAKEGLNYCKMVYGKYDEQLIQKLRENGFRVMPKMDLFPHIPYGATNCLTKYVVW